MTTVALAALPQFFDNGGDPASGGQLFTYAAGTLTPLATYTDRSGTVPNSNPVILNSSGRADIWLTINTAYQLILKDSLGNVLDSVDNFYAGADPAQLTAAGIVPATGGTYTGLVSFTGGATFDGTATQDLATLDSLGIASVQNANLWINSDFANLTASGSVADAGLASGLTYALCDTGSVTVSKLSQPQDGIPSALRLTQPDAAPKRIGFVQQIPADNIIAYRGKQLVLVPKLRCSAAATARVAIVAWTGTIDAAPIDVVNTWSSTTYTAGNFFIANTSTIAVTATALSANTWADALASSASAGGVVVPTGTNNLYMVVWTDAAVAQNVTFDASVIRAGQGVLTPQWTPPNQQAELTRLSYRTAKFTANGSLVVPAGVTTLYVSGCAGGSGGGGGASGSLGFGAGGGGGSAGQNIIRQAFSVTPGQTLAVVIGAGGPGAAAAAAGNGNNSTAGGNTTIVALGLTLTGGAVSAGGGSSAGAAAGGAAGNGFPRGSHGQDANAGASACGGMGASGPFGGGGGAARGTSIGGVAGNDAGGFGAGGGGGGGTYTSGAGTGGAGGAGTPGLILLEW